MNIIADTNLLVRILVEDDAAQALAARATLDQADRIAIGNSALCELAWVLSRAYRQSTEEVAAAIRGLANAARVVMDREAVTAGLTMADAGGDFADGIIAFEGRKLGGETFVSFDKTAVRLLQDFGAAAQHL
jgi:predicted nucleic-acid-binding protein